MHLQCSSNKRLRYDKSRNGQYEFQRSFRTLMLLPVFAILSLCFYTHSPAQAPSETDCVKLAERLVREKDPRVLTSPAVIEIDRLKITFVYGDARLLKGTMPELSDSRVRALFQSALSLAVFEQYLSRARNVDRKVWEPYIVQAKEILRKALSKTSSEPYDDELLKIVSIPRMLMLDAATKQGQVRKLRLVTPDEIRQLVLKITFKTEPTNCQISIVKAGYYNVLKSSTPASMWRDISGGNPESIEGGNWAIRVRTHQKQPWRVGIVSLMSAGVRTVSYKSFGEEVK